MMNQITLHFDDNSQVIIHTDRIDYYMPPLAQRIGGKRLQATQWLDESGESSLVVYAKEALERNSPNGVNVCEPIAYGDLTPTDDKVYVTHSLDRVSYSLIISLALLVVIGYVIGQYFSH
jgi:hypothetical protein